MFSLSLCFGIATDTSTCAHKLHPSLRPLVSTPPWESGKMFFLHFTSLTLIYECVLHAILRNPDEQILSMDLQETGPDV